MSSIAYTLPMPRLQILSHGLRLPSWVADIDDQEEVRDFNVIDAMAASGDYFITLATRLDKMAQGLAPDCSEQIEIEHLVKTLFYMQEHYDLVAKYKRR